MKNGILSYTDYFFRNQTTLKKFDNVYKTNKEGIKAAKYKGVYYVWDNKGHWSWSKKKTPFIKYLAENKILVLG